MAYFQFQWTDEIVAHLSEHDVSRDDFESVVNRPSDAARAAPLGGHVAGARRLTAATCFAFMSILTC